MFCGRVDGVEEVLAKKQLALKVLVPRWQQQVEHSERQKTLILALAITSLAHDTSHTLSTLLPAPATLTRVVITAKSTRTADNMHVNKAHAALLIASAGALTGGTQRKPFPKLRPLKSALAAKPDLFGINEEDALLNSKREGQDNFRGAFEKAAFLNADVFGFRDEARVIANTAARPGQQNYMSVLKGALGFPDKIKGNDGACTIDYSSPDLRTPIRDGGSPSVVVSYASADLRPAASQALPFLDRPEVLDEVRLAGDAGFDPLGLATDAESLIRYRDAELKHGRLAMLAAVGWPLGELFQPDLAAQWHAPSLVFAQGGENPSVLNGGLQNVPVVFWAGTLAVAVAAELAGLQASAAGKAPGDLGLRAGQKLLASALGGSEATVADAELANGRVAMLAVVAYVLQEFAATSSGIPEPVVSLSYGLFHPFV